MEVISSATKNSSLKPRRNRMLGFPTWCENENEAHGYVSKNEV